MQVQAEESRGQYVYRGRLSFISSCKFSFDFRSGDAPPTASPLLLLYWRGRRWFPHIKTPAEDRSCHNIYNPADKVEIMIINKQQIRFKIQVMEE